MLWKIIKNSKRQLWQASKKYEKNIGRKIYFRAIISRLQAKIWTNLIK